MTGRRKVKESSASGERSSATKRRKRNGRELENSNNNENEATSSLSPVEKALQNPLVLQNIFKFLSYNDLLTCQSVDLPLWSTEADYSIGRRPLVVISITNLGWAGLVWQGWGLKLMKTMQSKTTKFEFRTLTKMIRHLETYEKGHEIWLRADDISFIANTFWEKFGHLISQIKVNLWCSVSPSEIQALLGRFPNLSYLHFDQVPSSWKRERKVFPDPNLYSFPQVKTISFGSKDYFYPTLLSSLFQMMPNLNNIFNFPLDCIPKSEGDDGFKLDKIRSVNLSSLQTLGDEQKVAEISNLASLSQNLQLQMTDLCLKTRGKGNLKSFYESLSTILRNNQNTLEYISIELMPVPQLLEYPEMKAVKKLRLSCFQPQVNYQNMSVYKFFAERFDIRKAFKNLKEVDLQSIHCSLIQLMKTLPEDAFTQKYFQGVTTLSLKFDSLEESKALEKLAALFPDVNKLSIRANVVWLQNRLAQILMLWPKLISLKVSINVYETSSQRKYPLDSVFTGIPAAKCDKLRRNQEKMDIDLQDWRQKVGLSNMRDLKDLTLIFYDRTVWGHPPPGTSISLMSHVASFYGFQCLPNLKVTCVIPWDEYKCNEIRKMLSTIEAYVEFDPNFYEPRPFHEELSLQKATTKEYFSID